MPYRMEPKFDRYYSNKNVHKWYEEDSPIVVERKRIILHR